MLNTPILRYMRKRGVFSKRCLTDLAHNATLYVVAACIMLFMLGMALCSFCDISHAQGHLEAITAVSIEGYTPVQWCEAIRKAEGNDNYGILAHYKNTSYRQACINTVIHKHKQWLKGGKRGSFLGYLSVRYAPIGANNDPDGLNINWKHNVRYWLERG